MEKEVIITILKDIMEDMESSLLESKEKYLRSETATKLGYVECTLELALNRISKLIENSIK
jgi:hypothetical protein